MRYSRQREMILNEMKDRYDHPTADTLYADLREKEPNLSLATVYRNLNQLADLGTIRRMHTTDGKTRFDGTLAPHEHMHCVQCGRVWIVRRNFAAYCKIRFSSTPVFPLRHMSCLSREPARNVQKKLYKTRFWVKIRISKSKERF